MVNRVNKDGNTSSGKKPRHGGDDSKKEVRVLHKMRTLTKKTGK